MSSRPRILLLSAYDAASHRYWREWLESTFTDFAWTSLSLPDRHFFWRIRSNALTFIEYYSSELSLNYDLIIATSMTDLATLRGLVPGLARLPAIVYFHENQFAYPLNDQKQQYKSNIVNAQLNSILTASCADILVFNSRYNYSSFIEGVCGFIKKMPDGINQCVADKFSARARVLPVPVRSAPVADVPNDQGVKEIVWNHRWEYDKQPEVFFEVLYKLADDGLSFKLHLMGQVFRNVPQCFTDAKQRLADRILTWGHQPREQYFRTLERAHIVVSTAAHDFQGLGMQEAIYRSCVPVAPRRMAYPEYIPTELLYAVEDEVTSLVTLLEQRIVTDVPAAPDVSRYLDVNLQGQYRQLMLDALGTVNSDTGIVESRFIYNET